jgi:sugar lactone lactonase YvrE
MQATWNRFITPARSLVKGAWLGLFAILISGLNVTARAATPPLPIVVSQNRTLGYFPSGGWSASQSPLSGSFAVTPNGYVVIGTEWGNNVMEYPFTGAAAALGNAQLAPYILATMSGWNPGPVTVDGYGNLYMAAEGYDAHIYKIPYDAANGTYTGFTAAPTSNCLGGTQDTAPCLFAPNFKSVFTTQSGFAALAFDASGNLFIATSAVAAPANAIYKCNATCETSTSATPALLYTDTNAVGALAVDPWGNVFFSDGSNGSSGVTNLNEIPLVSASYASKPTVLESYTNAAGYNNGFSGVAADSKGTIYFVTNADGIFAIPNTQSGGPNLAGLYKVASGGGYGIALDSIGNVYLLHYASTPPSGDANYAVDQYIVNSLALSSTATSTATVFDNSGSCTPTLTLTATEFGVATSEFTATAGTSCSAALGTSNGTLSPAVSLTGAVISATATFSPTQVGPRSAALTIADSAAGASGTITLTGVGQGALANLDPGARTSFTTGFTTPASVVADAAGDLFIADSGAGKVFEITKGSSTPTAIGTGFANPAALAFDANGDLFIADGTSNDVVEIANTGTTGAFVAGAQSTVVTSSATIGGVALNSPTGLAVGSNGVLYLTDEGNKRVVTYNPTNGVTGLTVASAANGLSQPMGLAVDSSNNLYIADPLAGGVFLLSSGGAVSTLTASAVPNPNGVAVDASGSLLIADKSGAIVRIPNLAKTLTTASAATLETVSPQASSLSIDSLGDIFVASGTGKAVYAIQRTAATIDLGAVQDGLTNSGTVSLMNAGNAAINLGTPVVSGITNSMFTLAASGSNGCTSGGSGSPGAFCVLTATFAPPVGTASGSESGTATINFSPSGTAMVNMTGSATQSAVQAQTITSFNPPANLLVGQQVKLTATGGGSGNPVIFTLDSSGCSTCATISGSTLTALAAGTIKVDANQASGSNSGTQYAAAAQVQVSITISNATVAGVPALLMSQVNWVGQLVSGGFTAGANPAGGSFAIDAAGDVISGNQYGGSVLLFPAGTTNAPITLGAISNPGGVTIDANNNLYISHDYNNIILKVPFVKGAYVTLTDASSPPACTGKDTQLCAFANAGHPVKAMTFDSAGNFYMVTVPGSTGGNAVYECNTSCQPAGTGTLVYTDSTPIASIAVDPWGNLFFADAVYTSESNQASSSSNLNELRYTAGTGFAATPITLQTLTIPPPIGNYNDELDGVAVGANGTVYYATQYEGIFAIPNTQTGGPVVANQYAVAPQGAKAMELDPNGNLWVASYHSSHDSFAEVPVGTLTTPIAQLSGAAVTAAATVVDNVAQCSTPASFTITSTNPEFLATAGGTCSSLTAGFSAAVSAATYGATISFAATAGGPQTATLNVSETSSGGTGSATVTGVGQETPQTIAFTSPTATTFTYSSTLSITLGATGGGSNNPIVFTIDSSSSGKGTISGNTLTVTKAGSIVIDANQVGGLVNGIYYENAPQVQLTLAINQATQTIAFTPPASPVTYSPGLTVPLSATGGASTSPVVLTVDSISTGAGTISGSTLTVTQAGTLVIDANQAADANYLAAAQVQQTLVVSQASQTITTTPVTTPLHYIASCSTITLCATVTIQATGGATNNQIALSPDQKNAVQFTILSSTTSGGKTTAIIALIPNQNLVFPANLVIDANQQGNANYSAATQAQITIGVLGPLPLQTITWANPGTQQADVPLTLTGTSSAGTSFPVVYISSTASVCTVSGAKVTFAPITSAGTCTITATQPGDNLTYAPAIPVTQTFAVNPAKTAPNIGVSLSLSSLTMQSGTVGLTQITVNSVNNFAGSLSLSCSGLPQGYTCNFNPNPLLFTPAAATGMPQTVTASATLTINGPATAANENGRPLVPIATLALALCFIGFRKRGRLYLFPLLLAVVVGLGLFSGCGGTSATTVKSSSSSVTVSAASSGLSGASASVQQSVTLTLITE